MLLNVYSDPSFASFEISPTQLSHAIFRVEQAKTEILIWR